VTDIWSVKLHVCIEFEMLNTECTHYKELS